MGNSILCIVILSATLLLPDCAQIKCSRKSQEFQCHGIGRFSDTVEVCDLSHQICQYVDNKKPLCVEKTVDPVICNNTDDIKCTCDYHNNGYPFCACADRGTIEQISGYSWIGISACILLVLICASIFIYRFIMRRQKRLNRPSAPPEEEEDELPPPSYDAAVRLTVVTET